MIQSLTALLHSRKFMVMLLDTAIALALYFGGKYLAIGQFEDIKMLIALLQPVALVVMGGIAYEDAMTKAAGRVER